MMIVTGSNGMVWILWRSYKVGRALSSSIVFGAYLFQCDRDFQLFRRPLLPLTEGEVKALEASFTSNQFK